MGELWRDTVEALRRWPLLWVPVLIADLCGYGLNLGRTGLLHLLLLHETAQRSALGGEVMHTALSAASMQHATVVALLLTWLVNFLRILLYAAALLATGALLLGYLQRAKRPAAGIVPAVRQHGGGILELTLRVLAVYVVAALLFGWMSPVLVKHGHAALLHNPYFGYGVTLLVLAILAWLLPESSLRVLAGRAPAQSTTVLAQQFALILLFVAALLSAFVGLDSRELAQATPAARYPLEIVGSLVVALPYVLLFVGLATLARRGAGSEESPSFATR